MNRSNQLNPNNDAYWQARGYVKRPSDWKERAKQHTRASQPKGITRQRGGSVFADGFGLLPADGFGRLSADDY